MASAPERQAWPEEQRAWQRQGLQEQRASRGLLEQQAYQTMEPVQPPSHQPEVRADPPPASAHLPAAVMKGI
ncbi:MAG TPA: hypothetical protein VLX58_14165 [Bryobacteraceae bacterium]|nr:hypothetical protein [Bryobacteraceae bacterium]